MPKILSKQTKIGRCIQELIAAMQFEKDYDIFKTPELFTTIALEGMYIELTNDFAEKHDIILPEN